MIEESVSVKCSVITWTLWSTAGGLMLVATLYVLIGPGSAALGGPLVLVSWGLYVVTAAAVWTTQRAISATSRKTSSQVERLERRMQGGGWEMPQSEALRSLR